MKIHKILIVLSVITLLSGCSASSDSGNSSDNASSTYTLDKAGLELAATECANEIIAANDVTDPDPSVQDLMMEKVGDCIPTKNPGFICGPANGGSAGAPVCVWDKNSVKGPVVRMIDGVYNAFKEAGDPYFAD